MKKELFAVCTPLVRSFFSREHLLDFIKPPLPKPGEETCRLVREKQGTSYRWQLNEQGYPLKRAAENKYGISEILYEYTCRK